MSTIPAEEAPLTEEQMKALERRLADSITHPEVVTPWEEIKARALARAKKPSDNQPTVTPSSA